MKKSPYKIITVWPARSWAVCNTQTGEAVAYFTARILAESFASNLNQGIV
jgi:hypothetical protein